MREYVSLVFWTFASSTYDGQSEPKERKSRPRNAAHYHGGQCAIWRPIPMLISLSWYHRSVKMDRAGTEVVPFDRTVTSWAVFSVTVQRECDIDDKFRFSLYIASLIDDRFDDECRYLPLRVKTLNLGHTPMAPFLLETENIFLGIYLPSQVAMSVIPGGSAW